jgi:hypothetical protein
MIFMVAAIVVSILIALLVAKALRNACSPAIRGFLGVIAGLAFLFVFAIGSLIWTISRMERPKPFNAHAYKGSVGKISVPYKGKVRLYLNGTGSDPIAKSRAYVGENGTVTAPIGQYALQYYELQGQDGSRNQVVLSGSVRKRTTNITVKTGQTQQIVIGPPVTASIDVKQIGQDKVVMNLKAIGSGGDECSLRSSDGSAPGFQILSSTGKILTRGSFKYG